MSAGNALIGFDNKPIRIKREGILTPVDAVLENKDGENIFHLRLNLFFLDDDLENCREFEQAVIAGIKKWEGDYTVFNGQPLKVIVDVSVEDRLFDNVVVTPLTEDLEEKITALTDAIPASKNKKAATDLLSEKRSFAVPGLGKWSVHSRKLICIQCKDGRFDNYAEIADVSKHEFGHVLGLGDLYKEEGKFSGVEKGSYPELDKYYAGDRFYNLVMCDHHGPVSDNDIEMVILAFSENKMQLYQPQENAKGKISEALGKGN